MEAIIVINKQQTFLLYGLLKSAMAKEPMLEVLEDLVSAKRPDIVSCC